MNFINFKLMLFYSLQSSSFIKKYIVLQQVTPVTDDAAASGNESGAEALPKEDEEPKEMTLDEYKAMQRQTRVKPEFKIRKAGEGENSAQWKKTYILKKKIEESDDEEDESDDEEEVHQPKRKTVLDIEFQFNDSPMRGGRGRGRGGRGGPGGRGGRGGMGGGDRMGGGGGGKPHLATAGGKEIESLESALEQGKEIIKNLLINDNVKK